MGFLPAAVSGLAVGSALSGGFVRGAGREHLRLLRARPAQPTLLQSSAPGPPSAGRGRRHLARAPRLAASSPQLVQFFGFCLGICIQYFLVCHALCWALQTAQWQAPKGPVLLVCRPEGGAGALPSPSWKLLNISSACVPSPCTLWCRGLIAFFISWKVEDWNYILNL